MHFGLLAAVGSPGQSTTSRCSMPGSSSNWCWLLQSLWIWRTQPYCASPYHWHPLSTAPRDNLDATDPDFQLWTGKRKLCQPCETGTKNYVNRCEPAWKFMWTSANRKHSLVSFTLKKICEPVWTGRKYYVNLCEPAREIMWTGANHGSH